MILRTYSFILILYMRQINLMNEFTYNGDLCEHLNKPNLKPDL